MFLIRSIAGVSFHSTDVNVLIIYLCKCYANTCHGRRKQGLLLSLIIRAHSAGEHDCDLDTYIKS